MFLYWMEIVWYYQTIEIDYKIDVFEKYPTQIGHTKSEAARIIP